MSAQPRPVQLPIAAPAQRGASPVEVDAETKAEAAEQRSSETPSARHTSDRFAGQSGKSEAARALVRPTALRSTVQIPAGLPVVVDLGLRVAAGAIASRQVDDARATECAAALDKATHPFEVRLTHLTLERACDQAVISSRSRQRLNSSLNAAFGRTKERLPAERPPNVDSLGLARGEAGFSDILIEAMRERGSLSPQRLTQLITAVRDLKSEDALKSAYDAVSKVFSSPLLGKTDRPKLAAAFVQAQGRLRANVIVVSTSMRPQGVVAFAPPAAEKPLPAYDRAMLEQHLKGASAEDLAAMRTLITAVIASPLFRAQDTKGLLGSVDQQTMFLRMV